LNGIGDAKMNKFMTGQFGRSIEIKDTIGINNAQVIEFDCG
jgi:hypothetical protein